MNLQNRITHLSTSGPLTRYCMSSQLCITPLKTKRRWLYIKTQFVPRSKRFHLGYKNQSVYDVSGTGRCLFTDKYKTNKYSEGRTYNCWMLNLLVHHLTSRLYKVKTCQNIKYRELYLCQIYVSAGRTVLTERPADTKPPPYLVRNKLTNHAFIRATKYNFIYQILLTSYTNISCISGWCYEAHNKRTLITQVNLAQIILSVFHILKYIRPYI